MSIYDMDKFNKKKELTNKRTFTKDTWYAQYESLISYIPEPIQKDVGGVRVFLKPSIIINQNVSKLCMEVKRNNQKKAIQSIRNLFKIKNENKAIQCRIIRDIRTLFEQQEEIDFYKRIRAGNFPNKNSVKYQSSGDRNKNLSMKEYLDKLNHT